MAVFIGRGIFSLVRIFLHTGSFLDNLSESKVCDVQIFRFIPLRSWFRPKFPPGYLNFNNFHQVQ